MKTKLSFMILPVLLMLVGSSGGLFKKLIVGDENSVKDYKLLGKWSAYEYYDNNINPLGQNTDVDYSQINQIDKLINYSSQELPCPTEISKIEQRMEYFKINFMEDGKAEISEKQYKKLNSYDSKCINTVYDESSKEAIKATWKLDPEDSLLIFNDSKKGSPTQFKIAHFVNGELHLSFKENNDYIFVKLHKD
ncbi:hypothetical protein [Sphingobacterium endophyticum]|uniref:hypothetical protein n=1 Tax=Sphingobacterium endophyticum TaxID=2546448 RepID=UPI0012E17F2F|nr:hypothetical protein [Sphingobacterium endophyticum]